MWKEDTSVNLKWKTPELLSWRSSRISGNADAVKKQFCSAHYLLVDSYLGLKFREMYTGVKFLAKSIKIFSWMTTWSPESLLQNPHKKPLFTSVPTWSSLVPMPWEKELQTHFCCGFERGMDVFSCCRTFLCLTRDRVRKNLVLSFPKFLPFQTFCNNNRHLPGAGTCLKKPEIIKKKLQGSF